MREQIEMAPLPKFSPTVERNCRQGHFEDSQTEIRDTISSYVYANWGSAGFKGQDCYRHLAEKLNKHYSNIVGRNIPEDLAFWVSNS